MARFYGEIKGSARNPASRVGNKESGMMASISGWDLGIDVSLFVNSDGHDEVVVYLTRGSNGPSSDAKVIFRDEHGKDLQAGLDLSQAFFRIVVPRTKAPKLEIKP